MPLLAALGSGKVRVIGLRNCLLLGSTVIIGLTAALLPYSFATISAGTGKA